MSRVPTLALACLALLANTRPVRAQEPPSVPAAGYELFRSMFGFYGFEPRDLKSVPSNEYGTLTVVIFHHRTGDRGINPGSARFALQVLQAGGSVLIASDFPESVGKYLPDNPSVVVESGYVVNQSRGYHYDGRPNQPLVARLESTDPLTNGLFVPGERVATIQPAVLHVEKSRRPIWLKDLARFPPMSDRISEDGRSRLPEDAPFAVGGVGNGLKSFRCLVFADPAVFCNRLLVGSDSPGGNTKNLEFASRVVQFLKPVGVERPKCLFIENGVVRTDLNGIPLYDLAGSPPMPPLPSPLDPAVQAKMTDVMNRTIDDVQAKDQVNTALTKTDRDGTNRFFKLMQVVALTAAAVTAAWLISRMWAARHRPDRPAVPTVLGGAAGEPGSLAHRREELLQIGDYTRPVREYLDDLFARQGLPAGEYRHPRKVPPLAVAGADARAIRGNLRILWGVAYGPEPVSYSRWKELEPMIAAVKRAADDGRWRFAAGGAA